MPKDEWLRAKRKSQAAIHSAKSRGKWTPKFKKLKSPVVIPIGTSVLVKKDGITSICRPHVTKKTLHFTHFRAASKDALMFITHGWCIWVSKKTIGYT